MKKTIAFVVLASLLTAVACSTHDGAPPAARSEPSGSAATTLTPTPAPSPAGVPPSLSRLTPNELKWGISPTRNSQVTYQPDVIIMEHGSDAVRAMASNGMTWTIDANAQHADEIKVDKILFATGRVMGRVLKVDHTPNGLAVTLGPVEITEVIKDCNLKSDQPLDFSSAVVYTAPDYPGATTEDKPTTQTSLGMPQVPAFFASYNQAAQAAQAVQAAAGPTFGAPVQMVIDNFMVIPVCCGGLGITIARQGSGVTMQASATVQLNQPHVVFALDIRHGTIYTALVQLQGTAGFRVNFQARTDAGVTGNIKKNFFVPVDNTFPLLGLAVPLSVVIRQTLRVETIFSAQTGTLEATGEYAFTGDFKAGRENGGAWFAQGPMGVSTKQNLANTLTGQSMGVNGLVFAYGAKVIVGIGAFGFVTGPYVGYNTTIGVNKSPDLPGTLPCGSGQLETALRYGVGYQIPQVVTDVINIFMHALGAKEINSEGGYEKDEKLIDKTDYYPAGCYGSRSTS
jgi:hypothetical protein